jgi:hypothetical protein
MEIVYDIRDEVETLAAKLPARSAWRIRPAFPEKAPLSNVVPFF